MDYDFIAKVTVGEWADVLRVSIRLLARLVGFMAFRPRDKGSLLLLRAKAAQYSKEIEMSPEQLAWVIHGSVALAFLSCGDEARAINAMDNSVGESVVYWSERLRAGVLRDGGLRYRLMQAAGIALTVGVVGYYVPVAAILGWLAKTLYPVAPYLSWVKIPVVLAVIGSLTIFAVMPKRRLVLASA